MRKEKGVDKEAENKAKKKKEGIAKKPEEVNFSDRMHLWMRLFLEGFSQRFRRLYDFIGRKKEILKAETIAWQIC